MDQPPGSRLFIVCGKNVEVRGRGGGQQRLPCRQPGMRASHPCTSSPEGGDLAGGVSAVWNHSTHQVAARQRRCVGRAGQTRMYAVGLPVRLHVGLHDKRIHARVDVYGHSLCFGGLLRAGGITDAPSLHEEPYMPHCCNCTPHRTPYHTPHNYSRVHQDVQGQRGGTRH